MADKMDKLIEARTNQQIGWDMAMQSVRAYAQRCGAKIKANAKAGMDKDVLIGIQAAAVVLEEVQIYANNQVGVPPTKPH